MIPIPSGGQISLSTLVLLERFQSNQWCPIRASEVCQLYDIAICYYMSKIQRSDAAGTDHSQCMPRSRCTAYDLDKKKKREYRPKHTVDCHNCRDVSVNAVELKDIIEEGAIPILSMDPYADSSDIRFHRSNGTIRYTAISHVWSDGLGNPLENSLPWCQLKRIGKVLQSMMERSVGYVGLAEGSYNWGSCNTRRGIRRVFFWMDNLCIPVNGRSPKSVEQLRIRAISHIAPIFQAAVSVLVLDAELERLPLKSPDDEKMSLEQIVEGEEILTSRILGCKWLRRAWTLEEGALARELHFKVAGNRTVVLGGLKKSLPQDQKREALKKQRHKVNEKAMEKNERKQRRGQGRDIEAGNHQLTSDPSASSVVRNAPHFGEPLKLLLAGPLNENLKLAAREDRGRMDEALFHQTRTTRFKDAWNELLLRSATHPGDPTLIFAYILDFDAASIAWIDPIEDRLVRVVKTMAEVPLSLLFNTGNVAHSGLPPKDAWIPSRIEGDRLGGDGVIEREKWPTLRYRPVIRPGADSLLVLVTRPKIPFHHRTIDLRLGDNYFVVEAATLSDDVNKSGGWAARCQESYEEPGTDASLLLIDMSLGTTSLNG